MDLEVILPAVFNHGIDSWDQYHITAETEVVRDIRKLWMPRQVTVKRADFDASKLLGSEWMRANCYRVLGWHVLPRLSTETTVDGFRDLMAHYRSEYSKEMKAVIDNGVTYDTGDGFVRIESLPEPESQRIWR